MEASESKGYEGGWVPLHIVWKNKHNIGIHKEYLNGDIKIR